MRTLHPRADLRLTSTSVLAGGDHAGGIHRGPAGRPGPFRAQPAAGAGPTGPGQLRADGRPPPPPSWAGCTTAASGSPNCVPRLPVDSLRECAASEAALALSLYREFGPEGLEHLEGDFALVLWDAGASRLFGMRDPMGGYPLYWTECGDTFAFSTGLEPLWAVRGERILSREYLADFLMMSGPREEGATELCVYEGIHRVLPGTLVLWDARTRAVRKRVYWNWLERIHDPGTDRLEEVTGQYVEALRTAVRERLRGRTSAQLSGGMDSTSVALLARGS